MVVSICCMSGCASKQLNERMVIQGIGIDYTQDSYIVTAMYMNTDSSQQDVTHKTITGKGRTITEAVTDIVSHNGLEPLYSHNSFILFGKSACENGIEEALEFFAGYYQCRPSVNVLVTETDAQKLMTLKDIKPTDFSNITESKNTTGRTLTTPMYIFLSDMINSTSSAFTALIKEEDNMPVADGIAVFDGDKIRCTLDGTATMGIMLARGESDISTEVIPLEGKSKSFSLDHQSTDIKIKVDKGVLYCDIFVKGEADVYEFTSSTQSESEIQSKVQQRINYLIENALKKCVENKSDLIYMGKRLRLSDNEMYSTIDNWERLVENGRYSVSSEITVG